MKAKKKPKGVSLRPMCPQCFRRLHVEYRGGGWWRCMNCDYPIRAIRQEATRG